MADKAPAPKSKGTATPAAWNSKDPLLEAKNLTVHFPIHGGLLMRRTGSVYAVNGVSFKVFAGQTLGLVGESGSGKTTLGSALLRLVKSEGKIVFNPHPNLLPKREKELTKSYIYLSIA